MNKLSVGTKISYLPDHNIGKQNNNYPTNPEPADGCTHVAGWCGSVQRI
jgi:hypothetical protein